MSYTWLYPEAFPQPTRIPIFHSPLTLGLSVMPETQYYLGIESILCPPPFRSLTPRAFDG